MRNISSIIKKLSRKTKKLRLRPIRVLCCHQVSEAFDISTMKECDWLQTDVFKHLIRNMRQNGYIFISLPEAHEKMKRDIVRCKKYVVLTADDGWATLKNILPWLKEQQIPITLFLNPAYLDGKHYREKETERYLTEDEVRHLSEQYPLLTIGLHGWEHNDATKQTEEEFKDSIEKSEMYLSVLPNYIPYFAYTWGRHTNATDRYLAEIGITPLTIMGGGNYNESRIIDRELFDKNIVC